MNIYTKELSFPRIEIRSLSFVISFCKEDMFNRIYRKSDKILCLITDAYAVVWLVFKTTLTLPSYNCSIFFCRDVHFNVWSIV